jgi:hypothetical protein
MTNAPAAETISVLPGATILKARLAPYEQQAKRAMIGSCVLLQYCKLDNEEHVV